jgi:hypothetical protein
MVGISVAVVFLILNLIYLYGRGRHKAIMQKYLTLSEEVQRRYRVTTIAYGIGSLVLFFLIPVIFLK